MKLGNFVNKFQQQNAYLGEFSPDTMGQETTPLPTDEIMNIIYQSMPTTMKNGIIEKEFNYADSTIKEMNKFFETIVENLDLRNTRRSVLLPPRKRTRRGRTIRKGSKMTPTQVV